MRFLVGIACLAATAAALRPSTVTALRSARRCALRSRSPLSQYNPQGLPDGWTAAIDEASGQTYYYHAPSGQSQWEAPQPEYAQQGLELPAGWTAGFDDACGATFYINDQTGQQQWETPQSWDAIELPAGWGAGVDQASGATYYYHEATGQRQWEPPEAAPARGGAGERVVWKVKSTKGWGPRFGGVYKVASGEEEVLGRYDMFLDKPWRPWVSRKQCLVRVSADGTPSVVSVGKPLTGWRPRGAYDWEWLGKGEARELAEGDEISLDYNEPEGTVFTCEPIFEHTAADARTGYTEPRGEYGQVGARQQPSAAYAY
jgi:hypothetical protein